MAEETGTLLNGAITKGVGRRPRASAKPWARSLRHTAAPPRRAECGGHRCRARHSINGACSRSAPTSFTCTRLRRARPSAKVAFAISGISSPTSRGSTHGVYLNCGSAVVLPEVFLKAVALARNQGRPIDWPHDGEHRLRPSLSPADQRRVTPHQGQRHRLLPHRPPRAAHPATGRRADRKGSGLTA